MGCKRKYKAVKENVPGDFYVEDTCCLFCGVPEAEAPELFGYSENNEDNYTQCFVKKQPSNEEELENMMTVMTSQELQCIRYSGSENEVVNRLLHLGEMDLIDILSKD